MSRHYWQRKSTSLLLAVSMLTFAAPFSLAGTASAAVSETLTASVLSDKAVSFLNKQYQTGEAFDGYEAFILSQAGQQLDSTNWSKDGESLKQQIQNLSDLMGNSNLPINYMLANQKSDGTFKPYPGALGTRAVMQALAKVQADIPATDPMHDKVAAAIAKSVEYFNAAYRQEQTAYAVTGDLDYRAVEALVNAGEDLSAAKWTVNGKSLKQSVLDTAAAASTSTQTAKVTDLAKNLAAVAAVSPADPLIDTLSDAILSKKTEKNNGLQFGDSIYDDVLVVIELGKTGKLAQVDQAKALAYLNTFKQAHNSEWGTPAGAAWGSPEESDLTAQVLQALSYFTQSGEAGAPVKQAIEDGFKYLQDIQNKDTGAIAHKYDSVFTTAETLIAIQANGDGYKNYNSSTSGWAFRSKTKTLAQLLLAAVKFNDTERVNRLSQLLLDRHTANSFENSVFSDMWGYIALGEAGKISPIAEDARAYILKKQSAQPETKGAWGETFDKFYPDFLSTTQAVRALTYLPGYDTDAEIQAAIASGMDYLKSKQHDDGGIYNDGDDALVDTAETVITLKQAGKNPADWKSGQSKSPVNYLLEQAVNSDGSFGAIKNGFAAAEALYAYHLLGTVQGKSFSDVTPATYGWAINPIETLAGAGIVNGLEGNRYEPARAVTRAEFAALLTRIMGVQAESNSTVTFPDVKAGQWYTDVVAVATKKGWIRGYEDGTFRPNNVISREEMAVILVRANQWSTSASQLAFTDKGTIQSWAIGAVTTVTEKALVNGYPDNTFQPKNSASRAEAAVILYRMAGTH